MIDLFSYIYYRRGHRVTVSTHVQPDAQALAKDYMNHIGHLALPCYPPIEWLGAHIPGWRYVKATEAARPIPRGALVIWGHSPGAGIGPSGHIAVCVGAGALHMLVLEQGFVDTPGAHLRSCDYSGVVGWWAP